jgi:hypothetical protein
VPEIIEATAVDTDPTTGMPWPPRMDTRQAARYLQVVHGLPVQPQTLVHHRARGVGVHWRYFGQRPLADRPELDRFALEEALQDESPLTRNAREREARRQAGRLEVPPVS